MSQKIDNKQYIIAIGASAGGLEAISAFFDYTPLDGVSYILIQHLAYDHKSMMTQILARHSKLEVLEVTNNIKVESNKVYLIPSTSFMIIKNGVLMLTDKKNEQTPYMTIDHFFISLAAERGDKAIGVILSGTGSDGSIGIEAIKKAGGMVIVQDPDTANYSEMPLAAIGTSYSDKILSPEAMPQVIENYVKDGLLDVLTDHVDDEISEDDMVGIISLIKHKLPLDFTDYKRPTILRRIKRQMVQHNISRFKKYFTLLKNNPKEIDVLASTFLISVTSFFRDPGAFEIIEKTVIPDIISPKGQGDVLKIWSAGCATGEEAYTIAILVKEYLNKKKKHLEVKIFATDINKEALDTAKKGVYADSIGKTVSKERLQQFFTREGTNLKIKKEIREMVIFAQHDLVKNAPYCNIDLISCRNLLIYMNTNLQRKIFSLMHFGLKKDGYLFLGPSESASILKTDFTEISNKWNILRSNKIGRLAGFDDMPSSVIEGFKTTMMEVDEKPVIQVSKTAIADEINLAILEESGFSGICTDEKLIVIQSFGDPSAYLKNQIFNFNLNELLPDNIAIAFKAAAHKALKLNKKVLLKGLKFGISGTSKTQVVNLIIKPFHLAKSEKKLLLILFTENNSKISDENIIKNTDIEDLTRQHLVSLEAELSESQHRLDVAYERIASSNENMQSFNEELLSANEEMQSANEELQSVNEELETINREHQVTNAELSESNDDLNNYFRSNLNGQIFVDDDLLLRKFSPGAVKLVNIRESDIGRPLSNITTNIKFETLGEDVKKVIDDEVTITREAESADGRIYQVMTMPYLSKAGKTKGGAIVSFYDVTELKRISNELDISNKSLTRINEDLNNFVYGASHDLNSPIHNVEMIFDVLNDKIDLKNPEIQELADMMHKSIGNFKEVITELAKVGKIEGEIADENKRENLAKVFDDVKESISEKIKTAKVTFKADFQEKEVRFAKKNLRSIILNLLTNAIKFSSPDRAPEIMVKTEKADNFIVLTVKDNGIGINKSRIDSIFTMYQRINEDVEGSGVGLYLVKKIIDASGGKVEVESEVGKGSTFKLFFKN